MRRATPLTLLLFAAVFAAFVPDLGNALLAYDDKGYILDDPHIRSLSLETVWWAFTELHCNYWAPLTWLSFALDHAIWGFDPFGYHLTNNLLHAANAALFFLVGHRLLRAFAESNPASPVAAPGVALAAPALAALAWGLHPLRVESVAWAAERKDVLSVCFGLAAILLYVGHAMARRGGGAGAFLRSPRYWGAVALYALSMSSKAMLVTLPFALLLLDSFPLQRLRDVPLRTLLAEKVPLLAVAAAAALATGRAMAVTSKTLVEVSPDARVLTAFKSLVSYLRFTLLPLEVSPVYFHPGEVPLDAAAVLSIAAVLAITAVAWVARRRWPALAVSWTLYVATLSPVLGLVQNGNQELAARFTYFPMLPIFLAAALGVALAWTRPAFPAAARGAMALGVAGALAGELRTTVADTAHWKSDVSFWTRVIDVQPRRFGLPYSQRAFYLTEAGEYERALADVDVGLEIATRKRFERLHEVHAQRARLLAHLGRREEAIAGMDRAIAQAPANLQDSYRAERESIAGASAEGAGSAVPAHRPQR